MTEPKSRSGPERPDETPFGGVELDDQGAVFHLRSRHATRVDLCLFEAADPAPSSSRFHEVRRLELERRDEERFEISVPGIRPGQLYGYRIDGPWRPEAGHRFDHRKLLVDPCARAISGQLELDPEAFGLARTRASAVPGPPAYPEAPPGGDTAGLTPLSVAVDDEFDWQDDWHNHHVRTRPPDLEALSHGPIYEVHVRGMTMLHRAVPAELRGTYLGMAHPAVIEHLQELGVSAVELMPIAHSESEPHLERRGLRNYWGYSPLAFCAPDARFATDDDGRQVAELKVLVRELHRAGIAVLIDVVLNHTVEGDSSGPTLSLRGIDNETFYRNEIGTGRPVDFTGCGNTLDYSESMVVDLAVHSLRVWAKEYHVDGFRFDLAPVLGRERRGFDPEHPFFSRLRSDPWLSQCFLIAEPWDLGPDGYSLGKFPADWAEWNDRYRRTMRSFWRGDAVPAAELGARLAGSRDLLSRSRSIDYVTSHDGFTLTDLVSYEHKHNFDNGEDNRDGSEHNLSRNWGIEGPSDDPRIVRRRRLVKRGLLTMLALSQATPMILHGDELGRSQNGNNNAYCQDNRISWLDWDLDSEDAAQLDFTRTVFALRRAVRDRLGPEPRLDFLAHQSTGDDSETANDELPIHAGVLHLRSRMEDRGEALALVNAHESSVALEVPSAPVGSVWQVSLCTAEKPALGTTVDGQNAVLEPFSLLVLMAERGSQTSDSNLP